MESAAVIVSLYSVLRNGPRNIIAHGPTHKGPNMMTEQLKVFSRNHPIGIRLGPKSKDPILNEDGANNISVLMQSELT